MIAKIIMGIGVLIVLGSLISIFYAISQAFGGEPNPAVGAASVKTAIFSSFFIGLGFVAFIFGLVLSRKK